jgi:hypothetical protein
MFNYDLKFTANYVVALSPAGLEFVTTAPLTRHIKDLYNLAINSGLQVSFDTAKTRDFLCAIYAVQQ